MSISFDGSNDGYTFTPAGGLNPFFMQAYVRYTGSSRPWFRLYDSGGGTEYAQIARNAFIVSNTVLNTATNSFTSMNLNEWTGIQAYAYSNAGTLELGVRTWTTGLPGAFDTSYGSLGSPTMPTTLDSGRLGTDGTNFYTGQLAEVYVANYSPAFGTDFTEIANSLAAKMTPMALLPRLHETIVIDNSGYHHYWPMHNATYETDLIGGVQLTAVDAPSSSVLHPAVRYQKRGRVIVPVSVGRIVSLGGYYRRNSTRIILAG